LLLTDVVLATIITALTGGGGSLFSLLFVIAIVEAGLAYRWRVALALIATISLFSLLASLPMPSWNAGAVAVVAVKFLFLLLLGLLVTLFSEQIRQEYTIRQAALLATARMAVLNEISLRLGESQLEGVDPANSTPLFFSTIPGTSRPRPELLLAGAGSAYPLPEFVADDGIIQLIGAPLVSQTGVMMGALVLGRQTTAP
jgi:hypothetical protein